MGADVMTPLTGIDARESGVL